MEATRLLYWFRTPPGLKVGRMPFDETMRAAIASNYPDVMFNWDEIINTPVPPVEAVPWRERRKQARAQRQAMAEADAEPDVELEETPAGEPPDTIGEHQGVEGSPTVTSSAEPAGKGPGRRRRRGGNRQRSPEGAKRPVGSDDSN
jgi:hypothetical protein